MSVGHCWSCTYRGKTKYLEKNLPSVSHVPPQILRVCIVVVVLCVLLSYVYLLYYVGIAVFYFRCRTAG